VNDRELLELAAKAAGITTRIEGHLSLPDAAMPSGWRIWNPLTDDGDALRLAVKLHMSIGMYPHVSELRIYCPGAPEAIIAVVSFADAEALAAATRRAIVRAAAEIGRSM
jgi:hypothetical protein